MNTKEFSTNSEYVTKHNTNTKGLHIIGLDMGYSAPKCVHENGHFIFPNYCKKITGEMFGELNKSDLIYVDLETGDKYCVGDMAIASLTEDSVVAEEAMYGRNHYLHPNFKIMYHVALGLALWDITTDGSDVFIQTGLPPAYITKDKPYLRSVLEGHHVFDVFMGSQKRHFDVTITAENVDVMYQPMGTYNSIIFDDFGNPVKEAPSFARSKLLVLDGGFGTLDKFFVSANQLEKRETDANLGMKRVLEETRNMMKRDFGIEVSIPAMQQCLKSGKVKVIDITTFSTREYEIGDYLEQANAIVREEALDSIKDYIAMGMKYLFITGGTGAAWYDFFKDKLEATGIKVIAGNENTSLPMVYANARGYYMYRLNMSKYC